jgi:hypothetical protein
MANGRMAEVGKFDSSALVRSNVVLHNGKK